MPEPLPALVLDGALAADAGLEGSPAVIAVPRGPGGGRRRGGPGPLDAASVLDALEAAPQALVLARPAAADPGAAALGSLARMLGRDVVILPGDGRRAAWVSALATAWAGGSPVADLARRVQAAAGAAGWECGVRTTDWRGTGLAVPALRPEAIGRWLARAWRRCAWCAGGGLPGRGCGRCGTQVPPRP